MQTYFLLHFFASYAFSEQAEALRGSNTDFCYSGNILELDIP